MFPSRASGSIHPAPFPLPLVFLFPLIAFPLSCSGLQNAKKTPPERPEAPRRPQGLPIASSHNSLLSYYKPEGVSADMFPQVLPGCSSRPSASCPEDLSGFQRAGSGRRAADSRGAVLFLRMEGCKKGRSRMFRKRPRLSLCSSFPLRFRRDPSFISPSAGAAFRYARVNARLFI